MSKWCRVQMLFLPPFSPVSGRVTAGWEGKGSSYCIDTSQVGSGASIFDAQREIRLSGTYVVNDGQSEQFFIILRKAPCTYPNYLAV